MKFIEYTDDQSRVFKEGAEIILTDRGRPVGKIVPIEKNDLSVSVRLNKMEQMGLLDKDRPSEERMIPEPLPIKNNLAQAFLKMDRNGN